MGAPALSIEGLHFVRKKAPGKRITWYVYAWRGGPQVARRESVARPKLTTAELRAVTEVRESATRPDPRTLLSLIRDWRSESPNRPSSPEWSALALGTQKTWGSQLNAIEEKWGQTPLSLWSDPRMVAKVVAWRDSRAATPRAADLGIMVLRELLKFGRLRGRVSINVATDIPTLYRGGARADIIWTEDDIDRFCWQAIADDRPQVIDAIWLAALTGLRREDLATVSRANVFEYAIIKKALKVSRRRRFAARMPRIPELDLLLEELESRARADGVETLLVNSFGRPWTGDGLGGSFNRIRDAAAIYHVDPETGERKPKHLHDLRGTFCTRLITTTDLTDTEIAEVMGWSPQRVGNIRRTYVDQSRVVVAIGQRIAVGGVNRIVNRSGERA